MFSVAYSSVLLKEMAHYCNNESFSGFLSHGASDDLNMNTILPNNTHFSIQSYDSNN